MATHTATNPNMRYVVAVYLNRRAMTKLDGKKSLRIVPFSGIEKYLTALPHFPAKIMTIRFYYKDLHLLQTYVTPADLIIDIPKLKVSYAVSCVKNARVLRNYSVTYSTMEDLVFSVMNYLSITQDTTMTYADILTSGEN